MEKQLPKTIDEYILSAPAQLQDRLFELREVIKKAAPEAKEKISWGMATFDYYGNLVHFSYERRHLGFHPAPSAILQFSDELTSYKTSKGTIQFPYEKEFPYELIERIVAFRVQEQFDHHQNKQPKLKQARKELIYPDELIEALKQNNLLDVFMNRPYYQRNVYNKHVSSAKRQETKEKRIQSVLQEIKENLYMNQPCQ